ncbi:hypothetical protein STEG23_019685 [Scotinomys teguina]
MERSKPPNMTVDYGALEFPRSKLVALDGLGHPSPLTLDIFLHIHLTYSSFLSGALFSHKEQNHVICKKPDANGETLTPNKSLVQALAERVALAVHQRPSPFFREALSLVEEAHPIGTACMQSEAMMEQGP